MMMQIWNLTQARMWVLYRNPEILRHFAIESFEGFNRSDVFAVAAYAPGEDVDAARDNPALQVFEVCAGAAPSGDSLSSRSRLATDDDLLAALTDGKVRAWGLRNGQGEREEIPALEWVDLRFQEYPPRAVGRGYYWGALHFDAKTVKKVFPAEKRERVPYDLKARKGCERWLKARMEAGPREKPKSEYREDALRDFNISARGFDVAWKNAAILSKDPHEWRKQGRPTNKEKT